MKADSTQHAPGRPACLRRAGLALVLVGAFGTVLGFLHHRQPLTEWLVGRYAVIWGATLVFGIAAWSAGHAANDLIAKGTRIPLRERLLLDVATGVLLFAISVFLVGLLGGLGPASFIGIPVLLTAVGSASAIPYAYRVVRRIRRHRGHAAHAPSLLGSAAIGFGTLGIVLVYLPVLVPENVAFDSRWYHLGIAEHYATGGRIGAFPDGWFLGTMPHLASWLYTWAFTIPRFDLHARIELAAHMEFLLFLVTVAGVPVMVERLRRGQRVRGAWAAYFLFPQLFLYDSSLGVAADHILAFWTIPIALSCKRFTDTWTRGSALVFAAMCAGAALTKYQAIYLLAPAAIYVTGRAVLTLARRGFPAKRLMFALVFPCLGAFVAIFACHWLANLVWYGNPTYPFLANWFPSHPWRPGGSGYVPDTGWSPEGPLWRRVGETLLSPFFVGLLSHDWPHFHRDVPVFGFLFSLSLVILPLLRGMGRVRWLGLGTMMGVCIWYWTFHQDRYLQALLPWMVAVTAATLARAWQEGWVPRLGIGAVVGLQLVWGSDVPFLPSHSMIGGSAYERVLHLLSSTFRGEAKNRYQTDLGFEEVRKALPQGSKVLLHQDSLRLGIGRPTFTDQPRWHGGPTYEQLGDGAKVYAQLRSYGVTHVLAKPNGCGGRGELALGSEVLFHHFLVRNAKSTGTFGAWKVWTLPPSPPPSGAFGKVGYLGCGRRETTDLRRLGALFEEDRALTGGARPVSSAFFWELEAVVVDERCRVPVPEPEWEKAAHWLSVDIWIRKR